MNFDALGIPLTDSLFAVGCSVIPLLIEPMSVDGRSGWKLIVDAVKRVFKGEQ